MSPTMTEGKISKWLVQEGDQIRVGDKIAEIEMDKAIVSLDSAKNGYIGKIIRKTGDKIKVGGLMAIVIQKESDSSKIDEIEFNDIEEPKESNLQPDVPHEMILMPALTPTMKEGRISKWNFKVGDKVNPKDVLVEIITDVAIISFSVSKPGFVSKIFVDSSEENIKIGNPIAILVENESDINKEFTPFISPKIEESTPIVLNYPPIGVMILLIFITVLYPFL